MPCVIKMFTRCTQHLQHTTTFHAVRLTPSLPYISARNMRGGGGGGGGDTAILI